MQKLQDCIIPRVRYGYYTGIPGIFKNSDWYIGDYFEKDKNQLCFCNCGFTSIIFGVSDDSQREQFSNLSF